MIAVNQEFLPALRVPEQYRFTQEFSTHPHFNGWANKTKAITDKTYGENGIFILPMEGKTKGFAYQVIASNGMGWEHVSVSVLFQQRCPTWEEMCYIKSIFWPDEAAVMQLHPPKEDWVNNHPYCLHLWRSLWASIPLPPAEMVGMKAKNTTQNQTK